MNNSSSSIKDYINLIVLALVTSIPLSFAVIYHFLNERIAETLLLIITLISYILFKDKFNSKWGSCLYLASPAIAVFLAMEIIGFISSSKLKEHFEMQHKAKNIKIKELWHAGPERKYNISFVTPTDKKSMAKAYTNIYCDYLVILSPYVTCSICDTEDFKIKSEDYDIYDPDSNDNYIR